MPVINLEFHQAPRIASAMAKALLLRRKGFDASVGMPEISASWYGAQADQGALKDYCETLDIEFTHTLPVLYPHVMAGGMHMNMLTHKVFPIGLLGAVHLKNTITQHKAITISEKIDIHAQMGGFRLTAKGVEFDFNTQVKIADEIVWEELSIYFMAGKFGGKENPSPETSFELASLDQMEDVASWTVPKNRGKKYASISGDYNPIHTSKYLAKLFGFKRDIAHGFGILAQAVNQSERANKTNISAGKCRVDVIFKGPLYLENDANLKQAADAKNNEQSQRFDLFSGSNPKPSICASMTAV
jgi:acyl dehydratase